MEYELPLGQTFRLSMLISAAEKGSLRGAAQKETFELGWLCVLILWKKTAFPLYNTVSREKSCQCKWLL